MWAIRHKKTKAWVYGTDHRYWPRRQRTSTERLLTYATHEEAEVDFRCRRCSERFYEIVPIKIMEVEDA